LGAEAFGQLERPHYAFISPFLARNTCK